MFVSKIEKKHMKSDRSGQQWKLAIAWSADQQDWYWLELEIIYKSRKVCHRWLKACFDKSTASQLMNALNLILTAVIGLTHYISSFKCFQYRWDQTLRWIKWNPFYPKNKNSADSGEYKLWSDGHNENQFHFCSIRVIKPPENCFTLSLTQWLKMNSC